MVGMGMTKITINIVVNVVLFILYVCLFGIESVQRYFENGVTIVNFEEKPIAITPPGIVIHLSLN